MADFPSFDKNGFLLPGKPIEMTLEDFEITFVKAFPESSTRRRIFENYLRFVDDFSRSIFPFFEQWVDGSFVSKKLNPNDLDFVTMLDGAVFDLRDKSQMLDQFWSFSLENQQLDSYLLPIYLPDHIDHSRSLRLLERFRNLYGQTRADRFGQRQPKGFVKLIFEK